MHTCVCALCVSVKRIVLSSDNRHWNKLKTELHCITK